MKAFVIYCISPREANAGHPSTRQLPAPISFGVENGPGEILEIVTEVGMCVALHKVRCFIFVFSFNFLINCIFSFQQMDEVIITFYNNDSILYYLMTLEIYVVLLLVLLFFIVYVNNIYICF